MSLLTIAQAIADEVGVKSIQSVVNNTGKNERQIRRLIEAGGRALCQKTNSNGDGWSVLTRIYEFTTEGTSIEQVTEYDLPSDFKKFVAETAWQKDKYWKMRGSVGGRAWERIRNRQASQSYNVFRIFRTQETGEAAIQSVSVNSAPNQLRKFHIEPAPGAGIDIVYEYVSQAWWISEDGSTLKNQATADTDESLFGDEIHIRDGVWRFKQANSRQYAADLAIFEDYRDTELVQDMAQENPIPVGRSYQSSYANSDESDVSWCP